uniref:Uncharacterized protein n=1 Tax=Nelumbo nucifera TaxID=4432 RepID=A0A822XCV2_NELNU|nr:TPA_asm: hypothetical protein HUJ06_019470 [Nelumbo nucifera]
MGGSKELLKHIQFAKVGTCIKELYEMWVRKQWRLSHHGGNELVVEGPNHEFYR